MANKVLKVRDRCKADNLDFSSEKYGQRFKDCEVYVQTEGRRAKLLVFREDEAGNGELIWWQWVPLYRGGMR